jgi:predicted pyridoxine 5'-phosphate oxidase superfamily flavin-nucleotide-binding protein
MTQHLPAETAKHRSSPAPISPEHAAFIARASLVFVMSGAPDAAPDVSPRGDAPGFVRVVDNARLQLPDRLGNNRVDTIQNVLRDPRIALVFISPCDCRALDVTGTAEILTTPALLAEFEYKKRLPRSVMEITVTSAALRHSSAFEAAGFWAGGANIGVSVPSLGEILADQVGGMTKEEAEGFVSNSYRNKLY